MLWDFLVKQREFVQSTLIALQRAGDTVDVSGALNKFDAEVSNILDLAHIITQPPRTHKIWDCYNPVPAYRGYRLEVAKQ